MRQLPVAFDMETADPDDLITLFFLTAHRELDLKAVTVTPGSLHQVAVVKEALRLTDHAHVPVGARDPGYPKKCVSKPHWVLLGDTGTAEPDGLGHEVLAKAVTENPKLVVITGAPLTNLHRLFQHHDVKLQRWVGQGGFIGANIIPPERQLEKFAGKTHVSTFNFGGDIKAAKFLLETDRIEHKYLVGKNVCHGVAYDQERHEWFAQFVEKAVGFKLIHLFMSQRLAKRGPKMMHDPLAAATVANISICRWASVEYERVKGQWGAELVNEPTLRSTQGAISVNHEYFWTAFADDGVPPSAAEAIRAGWSTSTLV